MRFGNLDIARKEPASIPVETPVGYSSEMREEDTVTGRWTTFCEVRGLSKGHFPDQALGHRHDRVVHRQRISNVAGDQPTPEEGIGKLIAVVDLADHPLFQQPLHGLVYRPDQRNT